jgi:hypothetical protein
MKCLHCGSETEPLEGRSGGLVHAIQNLRTGRRAKTVARRVKLRCDDLTEKPVPPFTQLTVQVFEGPADYRRSGSDTAGHLRSPSLKISQHSLH